MRIARRFLMLVSSVVTLVSVVLLLNFTASNPTGRRYSSETPSMNDRGRDGGAAERILALDLGVPNNNLPEARQCVCNSDDYSETTLPPQCNICVFSPEVENYRIPDFVTDGYIAEAKNYAPASSDVYLANGDQFNAFIIMAHSLHRPLWVFVAVDSEISSDFRARVEETGGGIVAYFTIPGYVDPIDQTAHFLLIVSSISFMLLLAWELRPPHAAAPAAPKPKRTRTPDDPHDKAARTVDKTEQFIQQAKESTRRKIDKDAARLDAARQDTARQELDDE